MSEGGAAARAGRMTVADFLAFDDGTDTRYELVDGVPVAMNPPAGRHVFITSNVYDTLMAKLPRPCRPLLGAVSRTRTRTTSTGCRTCS
jgi:Uma2 family endonuclease